MSIVSWYRIEPTPVVREMAESLAAEVRDPMWFLTRQWQFGEFQGEDAGSPAFVRWSKLVSPFGAWRPANGERAPFPTAMPIEAVIEREPFDPRDISLAVELGALFSTIAREVGVTVVQLDAIRTAFTLGRSPDAADHEARSFFDACRADAIDGVRLFESAGRAGEIARGVTGERVAAGLIVDAIRRFVDVVHATFGAIAEAEPVAWNRSRAEYDATVEVSTSAGTVALDTDPNSLGTVEWNGFEVVQRGATGPRGERRVESALPGHVRFRGMPNARFWDFEPGDVHFGGIAVDRTDVGRMIVVEFMLAHSNDWFMVPLVQRVGTSCEIEWLLVHDVFGGVTIVDRADRNERRGPNRWSLFSITDDATPSGFAPIHVLPPTIASVQQSGPILEEVRFLRDEGANMVWAIESTLANGIGEPWAARDRLAARRGPPPPLPPPPAGGSEPSPTETPEEAQPRSLRYRLQSTVPENWIPFVSVLRAGSADVTDLVRARMLSDDPAGTRAIEHVGRILGAPGSGPLRMREEEVPRSGVRVVRLPVRARWVDGSTHLWIARRKLAGRGEGSSGLRFDLAEDVAP